MTQHIKTEIGRQSFTNEYVDEYKKNCWIKSSLVLFIKLCPVLERVCSISEVHYHRSLCYSLILHILDSTVQLYTSLVLHKVDTIYLLTIYYLFINKVDTICLLTLPVRRGGGGGWDDLQRSFKHNSA